MVCWRKQKTTVSKNKRNSVDLLTKIWIKYLELSILDQDHQTVTLDRLQWWCWRVEIQPRPPNQQQQNKSKQQQQQQQSRANVLSPFSQVSNRVAVLTSTITFTQNTRVNRAQLSNYSFQSHDKRLPSIDLLWYCSPFLKTETEYKNYRPLGEWKRYHVTWTVRMPSRERLFDCPWVCFLEICEFRCWFFLGLVRDHLWRHVSWESQILKIYFQRNYLCTFALFIYHCFCFRWLNVSSNRTGQEFAD